MNPLLSLALVVLALLPTTGMTTGLINRIVSPFQQGPSSFNVSYSPIPFPAVIKPAPPPPALTAASYYAVDMASGQVLANVQGDTPRPIASITKLATALVIVHDHKLSDIITVPQLPAYQPDDDTIGLAAGEQFTVKALLTALLVHSANDAADTLAITDAGSDDDFAGKMNQLMSDWKISEAQFSNPSGLVDANNQVSPKALVTIGELVLHNAELKQLITTSNTTIQDQAGKVFALPATDSLLQKGLFQGIKTGYTQAAGECFLGLTKVQGHQVITVVLNSQDRFGDTTKLVNWINQAYQWQ